MNSLAWSEIRVHTGWWKVKRPLATLKRMAVLVCPLKGGLPQSRMYVMTPRPHMSQGRPYEWPCRISGAR